VDVSERHPVKSGLISRDETKFYWLNSEVGTVMNLLHVTTSWTPQQIHYAVE